MDWEVVVPARGDRPERRRTESAEHVYYGPGNEGYVQVHDALSEGEDPSLTMRNLRINKDGRARYNGVKDGEHFRRVK